MLVGDFVRDVMEQLKGVPVVNGKVEFILYGQSFPMTPDRKMRAVLGSSHQIRLTVILPEASEQKP